MTCKGFITCLVLANLWDMVLACVQTEEAYARDGGWSTCDSLNVQDSKRLAKVLAGICAMLSASVDFWRQATRIIHLHLILDFARFCQYGVIWGYPPPTNSEIIICLSLWRTPYKPSFSTASWPGIPPRCNNLPSAWSCDLESVWIEKYCQQQLYNPKRIFFCILVEAKYHTNLSNVYSIHAFYRVSILEKFEIRSKAGKLVQGHDAATSAVVIRDLWMPIWHLLAYITLTCGRDPASHSFVGIRYCNKNPTPKV